MSRPRFLAFPGVVVSGGQRHLVRALDVIRLHKLDPRDCMVGRPGQNGWRAPSGLVEIHPRLDGDYERGRELAIAASLRGRR